MGQTSRSIQLTQGLLMPFQVFSSHFQSNTKYSVLILYAIGWW